MSVGGMISDNLDTKGTWMITVVIIFLRCLITAVMFFRCEIYGDRCLERILGYVTVSSFFHVEFSVMLSMDLEA